MLKKIYQRRFYKLDLLIYSARTVCHLQINHLFEVWDQFKMFLQQWFELSEKKLNMVIEGETTI